MKKIVRPWYLELSSAFLVPAAVYSYIRIFSPPLDVYVLISVALFSTLVAFTLRKLKLNQALSFLSSLLILTLLLTIRFNDGTALFGLIPTPETFKLFSETISQVPLDIAEQKIPAKLTESFLFVGFIIVWLTAFVTDWGSMRLRLAYESVLPSLSLFFFASAPPLTTGNYVIRTTLIMGLAITLWAISQRYAKINAESIAVSDSKNSSLRPILIAGLTMGLVAVTVGGLYGLRLPLSNSEPKIDLSNSSRERTVTNPYIDLEKRLVDQSDAALFTVSSNKKSYWRIVGLDTYRNTNNSGDPISVWEVRIGGDRPETSFKEPRISGTETPQTYKISSLDIESGNKETSNVWIPAAFTPVEIQDNNGFDLRIDDISQTITMNSDDSTQGLEYSLVSKVPEYTSDQLKQASQSLTPDTTNRDPFLVLPPSGISEEVTSIAKQVTDDKNDRYEKMLALQSYFQSFNYSTNLKTPPPGKDIMEHFLETREGFCQQFSGTFAVMARSLGIPSRVAVGFTWGDQIGTDEQGTPIYEVKGKHAHAWPEIWFGKDIGWVAFEPTPGRGLPGGSAYTGLPQQQDSDINPDEEQVNPEEIPTNEQELETTETTDSTDSTDPEATETTELGTTGEDTTNTTTDEQQENEIDNSKESILDILKSIFNKIPWRYVLPILLITSYPILLPTIYKSLRNKIWSKIDMLSRTSEPTSRVKATQLAWMQTLTDLSLVLDFKRLPHETASEFAKRLSENETYKGPSINKLAKNTTKSYYGPGQLTQDEAQISVQESREVEKYLLQQSSGFDIFIKMLNPKNTLEIYSNFKKSKE